MKKAAGFSVLFCVSLLCVILLNSNSNNMVQAAGRGQVIENVSDRGGFDNDGGLTVNDPGTVTLPGVNVAQEKELKDENGNVIGTKRTFRGEDGKMYEQDYDTEGNPIEEPKEVETATAEGENGTEANSIDAIPDSVPMSLGFKENDFDKIFDTNDGTFRGMQVNLQETDDEKPRFCLEDVMYKQQEYSVLYDADTAKLHSEEGNDTGATYVNAPNIEWITSEKNGEVNSEDVPKVLSTSNTNSATNCTEYYNPGHYEIVNGGARQVSTASDSKTVTSMQAKEVIAFDVTCPDMWIGLEEVHDNAVEAKDKLIEDMSKRIQGPREMGPTDKPEEIDPDYKVRSDAHAATPEEANASLEENSNSWLKNRNILFVEEGYHLAAKTEEVKEKTDEGTETFKVSNERNLLPTTKTARITSVGTMFNEDGAFDYATNKIDVLLQDTEKYPAKDYTWLAQVTTTDLKKEAVLLKDDVKINGRSLEESKRDLENVFPGIFVKRGQPFVVAAVATDNGNKRLSADEKDVVIYDCNGKVVNPTKDGSYVFNSPNYPRADYEENGIYILKTEAIDQDGNTTQVIMPLYVLNTFSSYTDNE